MKTILKYLIKKYALSLVNEMLKDVKDVDKLSIYCEKCDSICDKLDNCIVFVKYLSNCASDGVITDGEYEQLEGRAKALTENLCKSL